VKTIVVSQPMIFPWPGLFEQVRLADDFVHYDDVALPRARSLISRVQVKSVGGVQWLTVPVRRDAVLIRDVMVDEAQDWRRRHLSTLRHAYARAPYFKDMFELVESVYAAGDRYLAPLNRRSIEAAAAYIGLRPRFLLASELPAEGRSTARLLSICRHLGADVYVTGLGALNYLDHPAFDEAGIRVEYMDYEKRPYPQLHGAFTPYVSILDLIANLGPASADFIRSGTRHWKEAKHES